MAEAAAKKGRRGATVATPARLKLVEGRSPGRDSGGRPVVDPPAFRRLPPSKPGGMSEVAGELWDEFVGELQRLQLTKPMDGAALEVGCETFARWRAARDMRLENGLLATNSQGLVTAPWVGIEERASKDFRAWCAEFGLTPAAEVKLGGREASGEDSNPFA